ncbi:MAG: PEP-utilizing enzyme [Candidatus Micrarchaeota archaeon]
MTVDFEEILNRKTYKQAAAGIMITISIPGEFFLTRYKLEPGFEMSYPGDVIYVSSHGQLSHYMPVDRVRPVMQRLLQRMESDSQWVHKRFLAMKKVSKGMETAGETAIKAPGRFLPEKPKSVIAAFKAFLKPVRGYWKESAFIDIFDPFQEEVMAFVFGRHRKNISLEDAQTLFLPNVSILEQEKKAFSKIRAEYLKNGGKRSSKLRMLLQRHAKKYWWIQNDYQIAVKLSADDFAKRLDEKVEKKPEKQLAAKKKELVKKYRLDLSTLRRLGQFIDLAYMRDVRKKLTQISNYYHLKFYRRIGKIYKIPERQSNFVIFDEYSAFVRKEPSLLLALAERDRNGAWVCAQYETNTYEVITKDAKTLNGRMDARFSGGEILYGNPASLGKAIGPACIIRNQAEFSKFKEGDVLITSMTRPEFVPLMRKAVAIITDEGGITSHAAIVARELGKPCIIGTQTATKAFKDGDLLEVNADHGMVKKLEKRP